MDNRITDMQTKIKDLDGQIREGYAKAKQSRGSEQKFVKQRLLTLLKKKKMYEDQMKQYYNSQGVMDRMAFAQENIQNTVEMTNALKEANAVQKEALKNVDIDAMEDMRDEMQDMMWQVQ